MSNQSHYYTVTRAQWQHIGFNDVHRIRAEKANENNAAKQKIKKEHGKAPRPARELATA